MLNYSVYVVPLYNFVLAVFDFRLIFVEVRTTVGSRFGEYRSNNFKPTSFRVMHGCRCQWFRMGTISRAAYMFILEIKRDFV